MYAILELDLFGKVSRCLWVDNGAVVGHQVSQMFAMLSVNNNIS